MKDVYPSTPSEDRLNKAIQTAIGAFPNGVLGAQTMTDLAVAVGADFLPCAINIYSQPCIIAKDLKPTEASAPLRSYANAISGSFSWRGQPCSILVNNGSAVSITACHYWTDDKPESVLYRRLDGRYGVQRCKTARELPVGIRWAVGGLGLLDQYDPAAEGFAGAYADVLRKTDHTLIGIKHDLVYLCYVKSKTGAQVNDYAKKMGFDLAVMLDGGSQAAINSDETKINTDTTQYYVVQAI